MTKPNRSTLTVVKPSPITIANPHTATGLGAEPTPADLAAIDVESTLIAAEIAVVDAEIAIICAPRGPSDLDWQRLRRARRQVLREAAALAARTAPAFAFRPAPSEPGSVRSCAGRSAA